MPAAKRFSLNVRLLRFLCYKCVSRFVNQILHKTSVLGEANPQVGSREQVYCLGVSMDITEEQMPPTSPRPPTPDKGVPSRDKPDTGPGPDYINPSEPDENQKPVDPIPDMDPDFQDPDENEVVN
jgi:hypothetical protein